MTVTIYQSTKFDHAQHQYYAEAGGHTLLRLTCGHLSGEQGGAIKTATASDLGAAPVYRDREELIAGMGFGVQSLGGRVQDVSIETDGKGRRFGEVTLVGSRGELIGALRELAEETEHFLARSSGSVHGSRNSELRDRYDDLCVEDGAPVYLSDGVYLGADGHLFE
jgi:hypothetical protein